MDLPQNEREHGEGRSAAEDGCPTELAVLQRFWRGQPIPDDRYPEWYRSVMDALHLIGDGPNSDARSVAIARNAIAAGEGR